MSVAIAPASAASEVIGRARAALEAAEVFVDAAGAVVRRLCLKQGQVNAALLDRHQAEAHGYAWMAAYVEIMRGTLEWAGALDEAGELGRVPALLVEIGFGEYLAQLAGGIAMSQDEIVRPDRSTGCRRRRRLYWPTRRPPISVPAPTPRAPT